MSDSEQQTQDERIIRLEETVAYQTHVIEELSEEIARQWTVIEQTRAKLDRLTERFLTLEEQSAEAIPVQRPPHY
ncbi:SlyX protein [Rhizobium sp. RU20A]|uniref:SlyX family protein n=1 Tax=Rhizobium sp. RU20A TaxID=1907412 RepID=UPI000955C1B7|nr:SlyX family protein [Rhizobium sp. RU20A]SIQ76410.1 SlyX protein [Rhizobium sp. RU20A]